VAFCNVGFFGRWCTLARLAEREKKVTKTPRKIHTPQVEMLNTPLTS